MGLISWWKEQRKWRQDNNQSWEGMDTPLENGWTKFQEICLEALTSTVDVTEVIESRVAGSEGFDGPDGQGEKMIIGQLKKSNINYYIYEDGAELSGEGESWRLERWDFRTLDELVKFFVDKAKEFEAD